MGKLVCVFLVFISNTYYIAILSIQYFNLVRRKIMKNFDLGRLLKNKKALSTPIGNLIILLAAVVHSTTVVIFAINVMTNQAQKEKVYVDTTYVWYLNPSYSLAAIALTNTGPTDIVITKINIKGLQSQWAGTDNYVVYCKSTEQCPQTSNTSQTSTQQSTQQ